MRKRTKNADRPIGKLTIVDDFLPTPAELAKEFKTQRVTIDIEKETVDFFKESADKTGAKYQRLMREVLKRYARHAGR
jgi:predicted DNA binding CopG/RHH family protein